MMKNVYIIDDHASSKTNGIGSYIRELIYCMQQAGAKVHVVTCNDETEQFRMAREGEVDKMLIPPMPGYFMENYKTISAFLHLYICDSPDNLFVVNHSPCESFLKSLKKWFPQSKLAFVIHDMGWTFKLLGDKQKLAEIVRLADSDEIRKEYKGLIDYFMKEQQMYALVDKVIVLAKETRELLKQVYGVEETKLFFSPNGLRDSCPAVRVPEEKAALKRKLHLPAHEKIILYTGRNNEVKGIYPLVTGFERVLQRYPNCRLVIAGTLFDPYKLLKQASAAAAKISFTGQVTAEKVREWYGVADIGVLPSYLEQCSYTGIEMMMYGLPIVASDGFCVKDMFADGENARVARIGDRSDPHEFEDNLAEALLELLQSESLCARLGKAARKVYESQYEIRYMQERYRRFIFR
jgi:glycosyltransferase